jgi:antirestriction protein ArdC
MKGKESVMVKKYHSTTQSTKWEQLLVDAVRKPGLISEAFRAFHGYSLGNRIYALAQCQWRGLTPGPLSTYRGWLEKGRQVRKGEKAIVLCRPITRSSENDKGEKKTITTGFVERPFWFVLSQTDGDPIQFPPMPEWDLFRALAALQIREIPFTCLDGNTLGYARNREFAISPLCPLPHQTAFHEMGHIVLGHTSEGEFSDSPQTPKNLREVEAEAVALLCCESLDLPGAEYARGYIQNWLAGDVIPEKSAQKVFHAADQLLRAGQLFAEDE